MNFLHNAKKICVCVCVQGESNTHKKKGCFVYMIYVSAGICDGSPYTDFLAIIITTTTLTTAAPTNLIIITNKGDTTFKYSEIK